MNYGFPQTTGYTGIRPASSLAGNTANPFAQTGFQSSSTSGVGFPSSSYTQPPNPQSSTGFSGYGSSGFPSSTYSATRPSNPTYQSSFPPSTSGYGANPSPYTGSSSSGTGYGNTGQYSSYAPQSHGTVGVRYQEGEEKDTYSRMSFVHITQMQAYDKKSTEELRMEDYQYNNARNKTAAPNVFASNSTPAFAPAASPFSSAASNPFAGSTGHSYSSYPPPTNTYGRQAAAAPASSVFSPTPTTSSFFVNPGTQSSAFQAFPQTAGQQTNQPNPFAAPTNSYGQSAVTPTRTGFFPAFSSTGAQYGGGTGMNQTQSYGSFPPINPTTSNPFAAAASAFAPQPTSSLAAPMSSVFQPVQQTYQPYPYTSMGGATSTYSLQRPTTPQGQFFAPQPSMFPTAAPISTPSSSQFQADAHTVAQAYRDPVGLSWLFPNGVPDELLQSHHSRSSLIQPTSSIERILRNKSPVTASVSAMHMTERWRRNKDRKDLSPTRIRTSAEPRVSPVRNEVSVFSKKDSFPGVRFDPVQTPGENALFKLSSVDRSDIEVSFKAYNPEPIHRTIPLDRKARVSDLQEKISKLLNPHPNERIELVFRGRKLRADESIASAGLNPSEDVTVVLEPMGVPTTNTVDKGLQPKLTRLGYSTIPSIATLSQLTLTDLRHIRDFTVKNEHGEVMFEGETDVSGLDLDLIVEIEQKAVVLYPENKGLTKPAIGKGLNKPAIVRLFNCTPKKEMRRNEFEQKIRKVCERNGSQFVSYDSGSGEWVFRVAHF